MTSKSFNRVFFILATLVFLIVAIRAFTVPFAHDEAATFFYYIQTGNFLPYASHSDANNHLLNSFLAWICFHLFGDSPLSLRLPNLLALIVLVVAVYRLTKRLTHISSKIILAAGLLLSFHWLDFFCLCRGYGISMALTTLALSYVPDYIENKKLAGILKIYILLNLALCANLSLVLMVLFITALFSFFQIYHKTFFQVRAIILLCIQAFIILFWVKYSFYLQDLHLLYAGPGASYWNVTFTSLIDAIAGKHNFGIDAFIVFLYIAQISVGSYFLIKNIKQIKSNNNIFILFLIVLLNGLILGFYLLKELTGVNFPEDRAVLVFYVLFILSAAFILDQTKPAFSNTIAVAVLAVSVTHFAWNINFRKHSMDMYKSMPEHFYDRLLLEQKQSDERITIGGHRLKELFYAFMNYRHNGALNLMDPPEKMLMNTDYYVALKKDKKYYVPYYQEIDSDPDFNFTLLKRKQPLVRKPILFIAGQEMDISKDKEYSDFFEIKDTTFSNPNPLLVEFNFKILDGDMPPLLWIVISMDSAEGKMLYYRRIPLNWIKLNWSDSSGNSDYILETGRLPPKIHRFVCYLWNLQRQRLKIIMNNIKVFQLEGYGADVNVSTLKSPGI